MSKEELIEARIMRKVMAYRRARRRKIIKVSIIIGYLIMMVICCFAAIHMLKPNTPEVININVVPSEISTVSDSDSTCSLGGIVIENVESLTITEIDEINICESDSEVVIRTVTDKEMQKRIEEYEKEFAEGKLFNVPLSEELQRYIYGVSEEFDVPVGLIIAIIDWESDFDPNARSASGDSGYMQVNDCNLETLRRELGITDIYDPYQNILGGTYILAACLEQGDNLNTSLMCYNMGYKKAKELWKSGVYSSAYSRGVSQLYLYTYSE